MRYAPRRLTLWAGFAAVLAAGVAGFSATASAASSGHDPLTAPPEVRVNQVGYPTDSTKVAFVMLSEPATSVAFTVLDASGAVAYRGYSQDNLGPWNSFYPDVFELDFSSLTAPGTYHVAAVAQGTTITSPTFLVAAPADLYHQLVLNAVRYFTSERDGPDVVHSVMDREPANLTDENAYVYIAPKFAANGPYSDDIIGGTLNAIGGPVNLSGGWFDAGGGYERFAYTTSYADALMLIADRDAPGVYPTLNPEAQFGLQWLEKAWNPVQKVLYIQVGIGNGSVPSATYPAGKIQGDYNFWLLPQDEDKLNVTSTGTLPQGPTAYYVKYRPVFEAAPPGQPIDPDFAGRFAADFALGAQVGARSDPARARHLLSLARSVYAMAKTTDVGRIITTYPNDYYGGTEWKSDMLWGAAEIALADEATGAPASQLAADLAVAAHWARQYIKQGHPAVTIPPAGRASGGDTFNLYDNGALAEGELLQAMSQTTVPATISEHAILNDLAAQMRLGEQWANVGTNEDWKAGDPFQLGMQIGHGDATPHAFGLYITDAEYQKYGGGTQFQAFAQQQLNFALGANAWGSSFVVGAGHTFPDCMQSEIANLIGSHDGKGLIQLGATVDGPTGARILTPGNLPDPTAPGQKPCSQGNFTDFNTPVTGYEDNTISWPSVEPALDYTSAPLLAFTLGAQGLG